MITQCYSLFHIHKNILFTKTKYKHNSTSKPILNTQHRVFTANVCMCSNYSVQSVFKIQCNSEALNMQIFGK